MLKSILFTSTIFSLMHLTGLFNKDLDFIKTSIKSQIARDLWGNNGTYIVWLENDEQFLKGVSLFEESIKLAKLKQ